MKNFFSLREITRRVTKSTILGLTLGVFLAAYAAFAAWSPPTAVPPGGNVSAPVNISSSSQVKSGGLWVDSLGATNGLIVDPGNVGIGETSPLARLAVGTQGLAGDGIAVSVSSSNSALYAEQTGSGYAGFFSGGVKVEGSKNPLVELDSTANVSLLSVKKSGTRYFIIDNNGEVGIGPGTAPVSANLHIKDDSPIFAIESNDITTNPMLEFREASIPRGRSYFNMDPLDRGMVYWSEANSTHKFQIGSDTILQINPDNTIEAVQAGGGFKFPDGTTQTTAGVVSESDPVATSGGGQYLQLPVYSSAPSQSECNEQGEVGRMAIYNNDDFYVCVEGRAQVTYSNPTKPRVTCGQSPPNTPMPIYDDSKTTSRWCAEQGKDAFISKSQPGSSAVQAFCNWTGSTWSTVIGWGRVITSITCEGGGINWIPK